MSIKEPMSDNPAEPPEGEATTVPGDATPLSARERRGITTAISLLDSALRMRDRGNARRNVILARSTLFDVLTSIGSTK